MVYASLPWLLLLAPFKSPLLVVQVRPLVGPAEYDRITLSEAHRFVNERADWQIGQIG